MIMRMTVVLITALACIFLNDAAAACLLLSGCIVFLLGTDVYMHQKREKQTEELVAYLMKVQDGLQLPELTKCTEGQLGILQSEIYKLVIQLKEQAGSADREKTYLADMLSDISHQIKTPLAAITIMTDLLQQPGLADDKRLEFAEKIDRQVSKINWLIRNLLALSQLEADVIRFKKEKVRIHMLLQSVCQSLELLAEVKGVELDLEPCSEELFEVCDWEWTAEAFSNIVKNCLEHTSQGGRVQISVSQNNFATTVVVRDTGDGIAKEDLPHIFERFYKGRNGSKDSIGIGLALARQVVMRQNGVIYVESVEGEGSVFTVRLYAGVM